MKHKWMLIFFQWNDLSYNLSFEFYSDKINWVDQHVLSAYKI